MYSFCQIYGTSSRHSSVSISLPNEPLTKDLARSSRGICKMSNENHTTTTKKDAGEAERWGCSIRTQNSSIFTLKKVNRKTFVRYFSIENPYYFTKRCDLLEQKSAYFVFQLERPHSMSSIASFSITMGRISFGILQIPRLDLAKSFASGSFRRDIDTNECRELVP